MLDVEAASAFPADAEVTYSWGNPDYKYTQFIHRSGNALAQITDDGNFLLLANRLANHRAKDSGRVRPLDLHEHKKPVTDGHQSSRMPSTPAERPNPHRSPFSSPLTRPVQEPSLLHTALALHDRGSLATALAGSTGSPTAEQIKDEVEELCSDKDALSAFYDEAFRQAPSPSPRMLPVLDEKIPNLGLPPAISIREASPATTGWTLSSTFAGRGERERGSAGVFSETGQVALSGLAGRRQVGEGAGLRLGRRRSVMDISTESVPKRQNSQGSSGGAA